ncbi:hypothetical protein [Azotobacter beijerinckii]|uniref:hypothetical protein n=1 Tax=Azotobacter beijerinckii TaxID=170623 RepID=UPI002955D635|nr:hypothetical protein [Azotobacter beijerinckii]MDV7210773.1 hypothetical protein [Azotobacter beijerinckii]
MSTIQRIQTAQQNNQAALAAALAAGEDTAAIRAEGARLAVELQAAQDAEVEAERAAEAADVEAVDNVRTIVIERTVGALQVSSSAVELERLLGEQLPAVEADHELEHAAAQVARAQVMLEKAEAEHKPHRQQLLQLSDRLQAKRRAIEVIQSRRAAGDEQPTDSNDLAMLAADADALGLMVGDARIKSDATSPAAARAALATAEAALLQARNRAAFRVAKVRVEQIETAFVSAWRQMVEAGRAIGMSSPWSEFRATPEMTRAVTGQVVAGYRGQL